MRIKALRSPRRRWALLVGVVAAAVFLPTLWHGFVFDDGVEVVGNGFIRSLSSLPDIWRTNTWAGAGLDNHSYRPLTITSFALNHALGGVTPAGYHLVNILLHTLISVLVYRLAVHWGMRRTVAAVGALLFAVHPIHVEAVANVAGRKELLTATFLLATLLLHSRAMRRGGLSLALAPIGFALAMLSKETGVVTLGVLVVQDFTVRRADWRAAVFRRRLVLYGLHVLALVLFLAARTSVVGGLGIATIPFYDNPAAHASTGVRSMTGIAVIGRGLTQSLAPVTLSPDYSFDAIPLSSAGDPWFLGTAFALCALAWLAFARRRARPLLLFALLWYGLTVLPASNLLVPIGTLYGERLLYLPTVALCLVVSDLGSRGLARKRRSLGVAVASLLVVLLGARAMVYADRWSNEVDLFRTAVDAAPRSTKAHLKLGDALLERGLIAGALQAYDQSLAIAPDNYKAQLGRASALERSGDAWEAAAIRRSVVAARPSDPDVLHGMGVFERRQGNLAAAALVWRKALSVDPVHVQSLEDLGSYHYTAGEYDKAEALWKRAVTAAPARPIVWYNLATLYERTARAEDARVAWRRFLATAGTGFPRERARVKKKLGDG